jgi:hypothetical protein
VLLPHKGKSMSDNSTKRSPNQLLATLTASDLALLQPHLTTVSLKLLQDLETPDRPDRKYLLYVLRHRLGGRHGLG